MSEPTLSEAAANPAAQSPDLDVAVIGAGFSGLYMLYRLRDLLGLDVRVFDAADGVGGTWYWNRYPGARCDSESYYYSYSFSEDLEQEWTWSHKYPAQAEILDYLNHVADRFDLRRSMTLGTRITGARFDDAGHCWQLTTDNGTTVTARFVVAATGCLSARNTPDIPELETFRGEYHHTGDWPHDGVDFTGKRVGLIGTGSTGIQATPVIAAQADHLTVFQRTPNFSVPARNAPLSEAERADIKRNYREIRRLARESDFGFPFARPERVAGDVPADERDTIYAELWDAGGSQFLFSSFADLLENKDANDTAADFIRAKIRATVYDPDVAERLIPTDHPYGAKRPPIDTDYFETFNRDNVTLVDVRSAPIEAFTRDGLRTASDEYALAAC